MSESIEKVKEVYAHAESIDAELEGWMREVRPYCWRDVERLQPERAALLVVDMTKPFAEDDTRPLFTPNAQAIVGRVAELVQGFRSVKRPVIWLVQGHHSVADDRGEHLSSWWPSPLLEGTSDVEMASGLQVGSDEKVIVKRRYSGFYQTDLECTLRCLGVTQVVMCGTLTHVCPFATALDAFMRDFAVYYPADGTASVNRGLHISALQGVAGWCGYVVRAREILEWLSDSRSETD